jgi:DNA-binding transcriptional MocR family regulator
MLAALEAAMPASAAWTRPEDGMFVWMTLPSAVDTTDLLGRSVSEARVAFVPGHAFFADRGGRNALRLSFALADQRAVEEGIPRLAILIAESARHLSEEQTR